MAIIDLINGNFPVGFRYWLIIGHLRYQVFTNCVTYITAHKTKAIVLY